MEVALFDGEVSDARLLIHFIQRSEHCIVVVGCDTSVIYIGRCKMHAIKGFVSALIHSCPVPSCLTIVSTRTNAAYIRILHDSLNFSICSL
jgi:hypothetical protein